MNNEPIYFRRAALGAAAFAAGGVLFALYQAIRPFRDTAETMASSAWVASHTLAIAAFILIGVGLLGLHTILRRTAAEPLGAAAVVTTWIGAGLVLPYYGAETFGLQVIAERSLSTGDPSLLTMADEFRLGIVPATMFLIGLVLLGAGAVLAAMAIRRSGLLHPWSGVLFALGFALLIPQFFTPQPVRILHGLLVAAGCAWPALTVWAASRAAKREAAPH